MKIALAARIVCDPEHLLKDRWAHDTAHALAQNVLKARRAAVRKRKRRH